MNSGDLVMSRLSTCIFLHKDESFKERTGGVYVHDKCILLEIKQSTRYKQKFSIVKLLSNTGQVGWTYGSYVQVIHCFNEKFKIS